MISESLLQESFSVLTTYGYNDSYLGKVTPLFLHPKQSFSKDIVDALELMGHCQCRCLLYLNQAVVSVSILRSNFTVQAPAFASIYSNSSHK